MSTPLTNFQEYFREIEAEMEALRAAVRSKEEASKAQPPASKPSMVWKIPVMHFQGPVEPFTLTVKQLETVWACWEDVQGFLWANSEREHPSQGQPASADKLFRQPRVKETRGWAAERAAVLGVSPIPTPDAFPKYNDEDRGEEPGIAPGEEAEPAIEPSVNASHGIEGEELPVRERPNYGISRIDQPEKGNHGWYVRITKKGHTEQKFFPDKSYGGREVALENAREFRDYLKEVILGIPRSRPGLAAAESTEHVPQSPERPVLFEPTAHADGDDDDDDMKI